jgi:hypothetical protein
MSNELGMRTETEAVTLAESRGCVVVRPQPNELFVDIDSARQWERFQQTIVFFKEWRWVATASPSGKEGRKHVIVTLPEAVDEATRILYQAILGSDPHRELLSWKRLQAGEKAPTIFFEKGSRRP